MPGIGLTVEAEPLSPPLAPSVVVPRAWWPWCIRWSLPVPGGVWLQPPAAPIMGRASPHLMGRVLGRGVSVLAPGAGSGTWALGRHTARQTCRLACLQPCRLARGLGGATDAALEGPRPLPARASGGSSASQGRSFLGPRSRCVVHSSFRIAPEALGARHHESAGPRALLHIT